MDGMDETRTQDTGPFDDDRLLSYALGLESDAELEAALAGDDRLRARLEAVRADLGAVELGLERIVPAPPDDYTDLSDARWAGLKPLLQAPSPAPVRRRSWLRVLAPVTAVVIVLGAGVVALQYTGGGGGGSMSTQATDSAGEKAAPNEAAPTVSGDGTLSAGGVTRDAAAGYGTVVVARAKAPVEGTQVFTVKRVLKGEAGGSVKLTMGARSAPAGTLVVLYLQPEEATRTDASPIPAPAAGSSGDGSFDYTFRGSPALARPLPSGTDPDSVTLQ